MKDYLVLIVIALVALCVLQRGCESRFERRQERKQQNQEQRQERKEERQQAWDERKQKRFDGRWRRFKNERTTTPLY